MDMAPLRNVHFYTQDGVLCVYHLVLGIGMSVYVYIAERHKFFTKETKLKKCIY